MATTYIARAVPMPGRSTTEFTAVRDREHRSLAVAALAAAATGLFAWTACG
jgi:hypothetical protein